MTKKPTAMAKIELRRIMPCVNVNELLTSLGLPESTMIKYIVINLKVPLIWVKSSSDCYRQEVQWGGCIFKNGNCTLKMN